MTCKEIEPLLLDYLEQASDHYREEIKQHLLTCENCRLELEEMTRISHAIDREVPEKPGPSLREKFQAMLEAEIQILHSPQAGKRSQIAWLSPVWKVAAILIILLGGIWIGTLLKTRGTSGAPDQIVELRREVKEMKEVLLFSLLNDESATQRIKAVSYAEAMSNPDQKVIDALLNTLDHDNNVNVRLASLYSLARFSDKQSVRDSLIESLKIQTEPIIQVVLINILAEKKEIKAIAPIREILSNKKTLQEVKDIAQKGLRTM